ncbi:MAG TPA: response regulator transcription factor [Deltaproteobacteria bacterium]|jgi:DNA-binding NarL/FixJ family response regulator|nr:response regulator transcription factor [Deltaproteobacteria bacterium]HOI06851.1 response regulator transcription factor [Deltaproteobacteria bacterium]
MAVRILVADSHKIVREGIKALLEKTREMVVVGDAGNGRTAVELVRKLSPAVVIMDVSMPGLNGIDAARQIHEESPRTKIIALTTQCDRRSVAGMLKAGVSGYLLKSCASEDIVGAVRDVMKGRIVMSPKIVDTAMNDYAHLLSASEACPADLLTAREREVLQLIAEGFRTNAIAQRLKVSVKTVSAHRQGIMQKLGVSSVAELTLFALREGIITLDDGKSGARIDSAKH